MFFFFGEDHTHVLRCHIATKFMETCMVIVLVIDWLLTLFQYHHSK